MTYKKNITAILECYFPGFKEEIIDSACNRILEQEPCEDAVSRKALISHIENQSREWDEDYDTEQILGDIEDFPSVTPTYKNDVLDKIRAEIEALNPVDYVSMSSYEGHRGANDMKDDVLQIIDKYKAEGSDKE